MGHAQRNAFFVRIFIIEKFFFFLRNLEFIGGAFLKLLSLHINIRRFLQTDRLEIQCMCQSSYIDLNCKISLY